MEAKDRITLIKRSLILFTAILLIDAIVMNIIHFFKAEPLTYLPSTRQLIIFFMASVFFSYLRVRDQRKKMQQQD